MIVKQKSDYDCVLAVLSMASGRKYEDIFSEEFRQRIEDATTCTGDDLIEAYRLAGFEKDKNMRSIYIGHNINPNVLRQLIWGRRAMIQVPSLNHEGSEHFIYWDGYNIFDPSNKQVYKYLQHVFPTYVMIFDDAKDVRRYKWVRDNSPSHVDHPPQATLSSGMGLKVVYHYSGMGHNGQLVYLGGRLLDDYVDALLIKDEK